jgi:signal transduction histidine kinase/ligand-binding sensor domain-containing protein
MARRAGIWPGILLACCPHAFALDPSLELTQYMHTAFMAREGLKGSTRSIVQTPDGYLWLGTEFGLVRFDGVRFVPWTPPPGERLPSPNILVLLAARDGTLWIGTFNGLASWNQGKLSHYPDFAGDNVAALLEDHEGTVWIGAPGKVCAIRSGKTECSKLGTGLAYGKYVSSLYEDSGHRLWAGIESGLWRWNPGPPKRYTPLPIISQQAIVQGDRATGLVFVSDVNLVLRQLSGDKIEKYALPGVESPVKVNHLLRDRNGALWVGTNVQGLLLVDQGKTSRFTVGEGLTGEIVTALFEDREGSVWVGTTNGVDRFSEPVIATLSPYQGLPSPVWSVLPARDGSVWLGSLNGLTRWNQGQVTIYRSAAGSGQQFGDGQPGAANGAVHEMIGSGPEDVIGSLFEDQRGRIWGTSGSGRGGVVWFEDGKFTRVSGAPVEPANAIIGDKHEGVWISYPGQGLFHAVGRRVVERVPWPWLKQGRDPHLSAVVPDSVNGGLWLGFLGAGIAYFKDGQIIKTIDSKSGLGADQVWSLDFDRDGTLWAATEGGLSRIRDGRVSTLTTDNGLPCNAVHWDIDDNASSLWLSTACGLLRVDRSDLQAWASDATHAVHPVIFDGSDGFVIHRMFASSALSPSTYARNGSPVARMSADGKLWFAHTDGVSFIDPRHLLFNRLPPPVHIEQITGDGKTYWQNWSGDVSSSPPKLPPLIRDLEIDYTALSLVAPEKVRFRVKLEGRDPDWKDVGNERKAFYNDLPPRNYRFRVMASNNSGVWNEAGASFDFSIRPAYYQTVWFQASCAAAFLALLWALYRYRLHQIAQDFNARLEERVGERTRIARELHDTLLQSFHGLLFRFQAARNMLPRRPEEALQALDTAITRAEEAIAEGRGAIQGLRPEPATDRDLAQLLTATGQELTGTSLDAGQGANRHSPAFRVTEEGERQTLSPILQDEVYRIARELLRNAFQHADAHRIEAEIRYDYGRLRLRIRDDGKGIDPKVLQEGGRAGHWGLPGIRERARQIGARMDFWSEAGAGTEAELSVPASVAYAKGSEGSGFRLFRRRAG